MSSVLEAPVHARADSRHRRAQRNGTASLLLALGGVNVGIVLALGVSRLGIDAAAPGGFALWGGRMTGLLAEVSVLAQVLLAARVPWLEAAVGQDQLLRWHRTLGPATLAAVLAHPVLIAVAYSARDGGGWWSQMWTLGGDYLDATVAVGLLLVAAVVSVRAVRRFLPYEGWHLLHLGTYAAVLLAFGHQLDAGTVMLDGPVLRAWWAAQLVIVLAAVLIYRVALPMWRTARHRVRVDAVVAEGPGVVSVHLRGRDLDRLAIRGGQFLRWRFLTADGWWRSHPFSVSAVPGGDGMRLTARLVGEGTAALARLRPGTGVAFEGPYGVLTRDARTRPRVLLVGAGSGIAPIRALLEDLPRDVDAVVVQRASTVADAILHGELRRIAAARPAVRVHLVTGPRGPATAPGRPLGPAQVLAMVPDVGQREVYLCGPPGLTADLIATLRGLGVAPAHLHAETFHL